ncbi:MAG: universal stress protein [Candidatus Thermoplasmatota archaeon]|jgi:nucleotide-binding universal stress UspA family protein|nr:universal stress protein [Candidatus Thermoplasmatota archaeon]
MKKGHAKKDHHEDFNRIIAPVDGSSYAIKAAKKAISLAKLNGVEVVALYVVDTPRLTQTIPYDNDVSTPWETILTKQGKEVLNDVEKMGKTAGVTVMKKLAVGLPEEVIINEGKKDDLIVMGCKGLTGLDLVLLGSVCEKVSHHAKAPVLIVR